jgi:hypothetical protein
MHKRKQPAFYKQNTKDSGAELTLFYNMALDRINTLLSQYEGTAIDIGSRYYSKNTRFKDDTYLHLQVYLWKEPVSANFATIQEKDRTRIHRFLDKLVDIRNFQSHYYHDASVLKFPRELIRFIQSRFALAEQDLKLKNPNFVTYIEKLYEDVKPFKKNGKKQKDIYRHFDFFTDEGFITEEGKNFFLSFFLLKGEMNRFLKKRKRCKRDNGEKYQVKTKLYTWYCHRDGSNRFFLQAKKDYANEEETLKRQYNTLLNYLKSIPVVDRKYLPPTKEIELHPRITKEEKQELLEKWRQEEQEAVIYPRRKDKFMELAIRYFMDRPLLGHDDTVKINWQVRNFETEKVEKTKHSNYPKGKNSYNKKKYLFNSRFVAGGYSVIRKDHAKFTLDDEQIQYLINKRELKNWLYYLHSYSNRKSLADCIAVIKEYGHQYKSAMHQLCVERTLDFDQYPLVFEAGAESRVLSAMHKKLLNEDAFDEEAYRKAISKRLLTTLKRMKTHLEPENLKNYTRHKKNRILTECFNWYLPLEAKLKPEDLNQLSIYNFVAENEHLSAESRQQIIAGILHKLKKATDGTFILLQKAKSLNDAYTKMVQKLVKRLQHWQQELAGVPLEELHSIAAGLNVSLPGITLSRSAVNRETELMETILNKPVLLPNGLFKRAFEPGGKNSVSTQITRNPTWVSLLMDGHYSLVTQDEFINHPEYGLKDINSHTLDVVEEHYEDCFKQHRQNEGQAFSSLIDALCAHFEEAHLPPRTQIAKAVNYKRKLKEVMAYDTLLAVLFFEYHNLHLPLDKREAGMVNLAGLHEHEYELKIPGQKTIRLKYKQLDDLATHWNRKRIEKLMNNSAYWNEEELARLDEKGPKTDQQRILIMMYKVWQDSYYYIQSFLDVEKKGIEKQLAKKALKELLEQSRELNDFGKQRIEGQVVLALWKNITEAQREKFIKLRNNAFHTDIPEDHRRYETEQEALCKLTGIKKREKKRKDYGK